MTDNQWRISDEPREKMVPLIPEHKTNHPPGTHRKRVDNCAAMDAIFFVLITGCQWNALNATAGICSSGSAHRRFQEWRDAGVFERLRQNGLPACEHMDGIDWSWLSMDGCMTKLPLSGTKKQAVLHEQGHGQGETGRKAQPDDGCQRASLSLVVASANTHDIKLAADTPDALQAGRPGQKLRLCPDKGCEADWMKTYLESRRYQPHIQSRKEKSDAGKTTDFKAHWVADCWVVESTHSWMNRFRRILIRWEKKSKITKRCCILPAVSSSGIKSY